MKIRSVCRMPKRIITYAVAIIAVVLLLAVAVGETNAATAKEIDVSVDVALDNFVKQVRGGTEFLNSAKGVLVFPNVYKAGLFWLGGEYGEGALRIGGRTVDYYNTVAGAIGPQLGAQKKTLILVFMQDEALNKFRKGEGWEIGVDGSVALINVGVGETIDTTTIKEPIVAFVFNQQGLMGNITLEGAKFTKLNKTP
ncbi:MAG TPA: YSC84-related protein [Deltaproteobacteria bacterium]|nr:YSC84-related protein [Deltaproteobacteria bacterium]